MYMDPDKLHTHKLWMEDTPTEMLYASEWHALLQLLALQRPQIQSWQNNHSTPRPECSCKLWTPHGGSLTMLCTLPGVARCNPQRVSMISSYPTSMLPVPTSRPYPNQGSTSALSGGKQRHTSWLTN